MSNLATSAILTSKPANAVSMSKPSTDAGKFIIMNMDDNVEDLYTTDANTKRIRIGIVTKKNTVKRTKTGIEYTPIIKWSNIIQKDFIKSFNTLTAPAGGNTEDTVTVNFAGLSDEVLGKFQEGGKRIIVRLTFKDLPTRFRNWTESYEYVTTSGQTKAEIVEGIAANINRQYKRARVYATAQGETLKLEAMRYDDDNSSESINWAAKVRFNANVYYTDPDAAGFASKNKYFPTGISIQKTPGKEYPATGKLVRDRESQAMGYEGILNRGEGTYPIVKPAVEADIDANYDAITLEFENKYRAADDIQRHTKQTVEIYGHKLGAVVTALTKNFLK